MSLGAAVSGSITDSADLIANSSTSGGGGSSASGGGPAGSSGGGNSGSSSGNAGSGGNASREEQVPVERRQAEAVREMVAPVGQQ